MTSPPTSKSWRVQCLLQVNTIASLFPAMKTNSLFSAQRLTVLKHRLAVTSSLVTSVIKNLHYPFLFKFRVSEQSKLISKILEMVVVDHFTDHLTAHNLFFSKNSTSKQHHNTKTFIM